MTAWVTCALAALALWGAPQGLAASVPADALGARDAAPRGRLVHAVMPAPSVGGSRDVTVYLPPGYDAHPQARYPVVYFLHGLGATDREPFARGQLDRGVDALVASGGMRPWIIAAVAGGTGYWTNHLRPPAPGAVAQDGPQRWGDLVAVDLVRFVDARFRTLPRRGCRALTGVSMGGHGAMSLALLHRDLFAGAVSLGGALFDHPPTHRRLYGRVWGRPPDRAYWRSTAPLPLLRALPVDALKGLALYFHAGDDDQLGFLEGALAAHAILLERGVPHELRVTDGRHAWSAWRRVTADWLGFLDQRLCR